MLSLWLVGIITRAKTSPLSQVLSMQNPPSVYLPVIQEHEPILVMMTNPLPAKSLGCSYARIALVIILILTTTIIITTTITITITLTNTLPNDTLLEDILSVFTA